MVKRRPHSILGDHKDHPCARYCIYNTCFTFAQDPRPLKISKKHICINTLAALSVHGPLSRTPATNTPWGSGETSLAPCVGPQRLRAVSCAGGLAAGAHATQPHTGLRSHPLRRQVSRRKKAGSGCGESPCPKQKNKKAHCSRPMNPYCGTSPYAKPQPSIHHAIAAMQASNLDSAQPLRLSH